MESTILTQFAKRPTYVDQLRRQPEVNLISNFMKISLTPNNKFIRQYNIKLEPEVPSENDTLRRHIFRSIIKQLREYYYPYQISGDSLFSAKDFDETVTINFQVQRDENEPTEYLITIVKTNNEIDLTNLRIVEEFAPKLKSFIEIMIKGIVNANKSMVRFNSRSIFNYEKSVQIGDGKAFLMPGYATNVVLTDSGLYLRVNYKNKFVNGKTCYDRILELGKKFKNGEFLRSIKEEFKGSSVMASYGIHTVYKIDDVSDSNVQNRTIFIRDVTGQAVETTLFKYYQNQYNLTIKYVDQPLLVTYKLNSKGDKEPIFLVPELCLMTGMDDDMRANESLKKTMTMRTKVTAKERMDKVFEFKNLLYKQNSKKNTRLNRSTGEEVTMPDPNDIRDQWGLNALGFKEFKGRLLDAPEIRFDKNESVGVQGGKFRGKRILNSVPLLADSWAIICTKQNETTVNDMLKSLKDASRNLGVNVENPRMLTHTARHASEWVDFLKDLNLAQKNSIKILLIVLDRFSKSFYGEIKRYLYCDVGIPVQVVLKENSTKNLSYYSNVLTQMVSKMGGRPYSINLDDNLSKHPSMIIGYDCSKHGQGKRKFVMTASYDQNYSSFFTEEIIVDYDNSIGPVSTLIRKCLDYFLSLYKTVLPANLYIYRSGVNDSEKTVILGTEVRSIVNLLSGVLENECYKQNYAPKFCFLIVNKRTEAKFFEFSNGNTNNPKEGTVIDSQVTTPNMYEFYLQPQFVNSGTATPTHFHCIYDNTGIPLEILEKITYRMCYYYWNWSGAIREPAALKFAEVANKFSSTYLHSEVRDKLKNCPYYI